MITEGVRLMYRQVDEKEQLGQLLLCRELNCLLSNLSREKSVEKEDGKINLEGIRWIDLNKD